MASGFNLPKESHFMTKHAPLPTRTLGFIKGANNILSELDDFARVYTLRAALPHYSVTNIALITNPPPSTNILFLIIYLQEIIHRNQLRQFRRNGPFRFD